MPTIEFLRAALKNILEMATDNWNKVRGLRHIRSMAEWAVQLNAIAGPDHMQLMNSISKELSRLK